METVWWYSGLVAGYGQHLLPELAVVPTVSVAGLLPVFLPLPHAELGECFTVTIVWGLPPGPARDQMMGDHWASPL